MNDIDLMTTSNMLKILHGKSASKGLECILQFCQEAGYIQHYETNYRVGRSDFDQMQFYAPYIIIFNDGTKWVLYSTSSVRSDRVKGTLWDAYNMKDIQSAITRAYLIFPEGLKDKELDSAMYLKRKIEKKEMFSSLDEILCQTELFSKIEEYGSKDRDKWVNKSLHGNIFENRVAFLLSYPENLIKWKTNSSYVEGIYYDLFKSIVECFNLNKNTTKTIFATSNKEIIGKLPTGGNPKTDVLVTVETDYGTNIYTISCKKSESTAVTVHEYKADTFADVLNPNDNELRFYLNKFQEVGNLRDYGEENAAILEKLLEKYKDKLSYWVLGGQGGLGNPNTQWANYIVVYDDNNQSASVHKLDDYVNELALDVTGHFGTLFSWTYPSKKKGKAIQLKCKIL